MLGGFAMNNKLQGKDLINIGIFTAIYFIVIFAAASIGFIPIFIPLISVIVPLVGGIPMMLFFSKIKKFGMMSSSNTPASVSRFNSVDFPAFV